jgi:hypothetical protein
MGTRVIRIQGSDARERRRGRGVLDPAGTASMVVISGVVLAAAVLLASVSTVGDGRTLAGAQRPEPAPAPTLATPLAGGTPMAQ